MGLNLKELPNALNEIDKQTSYYAGNLKRQKKIKALAHHHFLISDCDEIGNLLQTYVFVQFVGIKMESDISHLLVCRICNTEAESLQQILMKGNLDRKFLEDQKKKYCIHCKTLSKLNPETYYPIDEHFFPWFFASDLTDIEHIQSKPLLAAVLAGGSMD